ncbi:transposase [Haladaptatus halobius]|uniref:transposase n=1 Tax=Haladaptatus halobius TaxID=2884875 RepID=UPI001D0B41B2|nr:transposase [Haladaptatus halobius]
MDSTPTSQRAVFRTIASNSYRKWPAYDTTSLYDRSSLDALEEDVRTIAKVWFEHGAHESVEGFVSDFPLAYFEFQPHDRYTGSTRYEMVLLIRLFLLKELHGWEHETALIEHLQQRSSLCHHLNLEMIPDQATLWRSWKYRFTTELKDTVETAAETILLKADRAGLSVPREPPDTHLHDLNEEAEADEQSVLDYAEKVTNHVSRIVYPGFSLDRGSGCEIHENAFRDLQTYLGLREHLAVNEGAQSFTLESQRERTPLGHTHRTHLRDLSIDEIREMYREAIGRLLDRIAETDTFHRAGIVAIDTTEDDPFTGDRTRHEAEIIGTKDGEYAYQWATILLVGNAVPIVLDARPVRKGDSRVEIVRDLLDSAQEQVIVDNVLMDREFDSQHILEEIGQRGLRYVVPKRMQTSEKAQAQRLLKWDQDRYVTDRNLRLDNDERHETTLVYRRMADSDRTDYRQYSVFMTNGDPKLLREYSYRWEIESGYKSVKRFMAATTSKNFVLRFFYFAFACLLYSMWRAVDLLVQIDVTGEYKRSPVLTANTVLTLLKQTGIG